MRLELTLQEAATLRRWLVDVGGADADTLQTILGKLDRAQAEATREAHCPVCGQQFTSETTGRAGVYCSAACKQKAYRQRRNAWRRRVGPGG